MFVELPSKMRVFTRAVTHLEPITPGTKIHLIGGTSIETSMHIDSLSEAIQQAFVVSPIWTKKSVFLKGKDVA